MVGAFWLGVVCGTIVGSLFASDWILRFGLKKYFQPLVTVHREVSENEAETAREIQHEMNCLRNGMQEDGMSEEGARKVVRGRLTRP